VSSGSAVGVVPLHCRNQTLHSRKTRGFRPDALFIQFSISRIHSFLTKSTSRIFDETGVRAHAVRLMRSRPTAQARELGSACNPLCVRYSGGRCTARNTTVAADRYGKRSGKEGTPSKAWHLDHRRFRTREKSGWTVRPLSGTTTSYISLPMLLAHMEP